MSPWGASRRFSPSSAETTRSKPSRSVFSRERAHTHPSTSTSVHAPCRDTIVTGAPASMRARIAPFASLRRFSWVLTRAPVCAANGGASTVTSRVETRLALHLRIGDCMGAETNLVR